MATIPMPYWWRDRLLRGVEKAWANTTAFLKTRGITFGKTVPHNRFDEQIYDILLSIWWENWNPAEGPEPAPVELRRLMTINDKDEFWADLRAKWKRLPPERKKGFEFEEISTLTLALTFFRILRNCKEHIEKPMVEPRGWAWYWTYKDLQGLLSDAAEQFQAAEGPVQAVLRLDFPAAPPPPIRNEASIEACMAWVFQTTHDRRVPDAEHFPTIYELLRACKSAAEIATELGISPHRVRKAMNAMTLLIQEYFQNNPGDN